MRNKEIIRYLARYGIIFMTNKQSRVQSMNKVEYLAQSL